MNCIKCGKQIPEARLKALPNTKTCVEHSGAEKVVGITYNEGQGDHCYTDLIIVSAQEYKELEQYKRYSSAGLL